MKYRHIVSVSGLGGLHQLLNSKNNGAIVKSLEDGTNKFIAARKHQVTPLESIEIYTVEDNIHLHEVFEKLKAEEAAIEKLDFKNTAEFVAVFAKAVPEYDSERVYNSDIKKMLKWFLLLKKNDLLDFSEYLNPPADEEAVEEETTIEKKKEQATKPKATAKKSAAKKDKSEKVTTEKPAKKTATKKTATKKKKTEEDKK